MQKSMRNEGGFTLIEILVASAIMLIVLELAAAMFINTIKYTDLTVNNSEVNENLRLGLLRFNEVAARSSYIYPNGVNLTIGSEKITTGKSAVAMLIPSGSTYCPLSTPAISSELARYCLYLYRSDLRSGYSTILPKYKDAPNDVIVEQKVQWIDWQANSRPGISFPSVTSNTKSVLIDLADLAATDLSNLQVGSRLGIDRLGLKVESVGVTVANNDPSAIIQGMRPVLAIKAGDLTRQVTDQIYVRGVPRAAPPGTGNTAP